MASRFQGDASDEEDYGSSLDWDELGSQDDPFADLTLPPINGAADENFEHLPSINDANFFDDFYPPNAPPRNAFAEALAGQPSSSRRHHQQQEDPPPSNQQQARRLPRSNENSQYRLNQEDSPDPFDDDLFDDFNPISGARSRIQSPSPPLPRTRASSIVDLIELSTMPPRHKRRAEDEPASSGESRPRKIARGTASRSARSTPHENAEMVDLVDVEDGKQYEQYRARQLAEATRKQAQEEANRPVKLAAFQCIICMDNPTDLTVTHCGHLFCSECLHQALHAGIGKKSCPVCRTAINTSSIGKEQKKQPRNGIFALEMKLMTANKMGKQSVRAWN